MTHYPERSLALMDADDGNLRQADTAMTELIDRLEAGVGANPGDASLMTELVDCLTTRAQIRYWAKKLTDAMADLEKCALFGDALKGLSKTKYLSAALQLRLEIHLAEGGPFFEIDAAKNCLTQLRDLHSDDGMGWIVDTAELKLAEALSDRPRIVELCTSLHENFEKHGQMRGVAAIKLQAAKALLGQRKLGEALPLASAAFQFFDVEGPADLKAEAALALACAMADEGGWGYAEQAISIAERLTRKQTSLFDQQRYLSDKVILFDVALRLALDLLKNNDGPEQVLRAWSVAERAKSFSLRQAMVQGGWAAAVDAEAAEKLANIDERIDGLERQLKEKPELTDRLQALFEDRQVVLEDAMRQSPAIAASEIDAQFALAATIAKYPRDVGLISWYWLKKDDGWRLHIFYAGSDRIPRHEFTDWAESEVGALEDYVRNCAARRQVELVRIAKLSPAIGNRLVPPNVIEAMQACEVMLATPHRVIRKLPIHGICLPGKTDDAPPHFLLEQVAVQILPTLALPLPDSDQRSEKRRVLAIGCGQDGFGNRSLGDVDEELEDLATPWRQQNHTVHTHPLEPAARLADHDTQLSKWGEYDIIHLACHGDFDTENPFNARLFLGSEAVRASSFLTVRLDTELLCLSACNVGQLGDRLDGLDLSGDEWLGLAMPLFQAGNRQMLASLWEANSESARLFMAEFHGFLAQGLSPAIAHRKTCLAHIGKPFGLWANWQLSGFPAKC